MTPLDQAIIEIVCYLRKQTNTKKIKVLRPHCEEHYYEVNKECIHFLPCPLNTPNDARPEFSLPLNEIFSTLRTQQYLYIYCYKDVLFLLDLNNNNLYVWMADKAMQAKIHLKSCSIGINTIWHKLRKRSKKQPATEAISPVAGLSVNK